ncbi:MAG: hypothetical protein ABIP41_06540 [Croceibacterium sp.]
MPTAIERAPLRLLSIYQSKFINHRIDKGVGDNRYPVMLARLHLALLLFKAGKLIGGQVGTDIITLRRITSGEELK